MLTRPAVRYAASAALLALAAAFGMGVVPAPRVLDRFAAPLVPRAAPVALAALPAADRFAFAPLAATRFAIGDGDAEIGFLQVAYATSDGTRRTALLHPPPAEDSGGTETRWTWWLQTAAAIRAHAPDSARIVAWWDNAQRARLLTGRDVWADAPIEALFPEAQRGFWREVGGGFSVGDEPLRELARALTEPAAAAVAALRNSPRHGVGPLLLVVSTDDLARAEEIAAAGGQRLPVNAKVFPRSANLHGTIASVRRWAQEGGTGSYLVQPLPGQRVRAWRVTDEAALDWLLIRALPFSTSLYRPIDGADLLYQSGGAGYLAVYRIGPGAPVAANPPNATAR